MRVGARCRIPHRGPSQLARRTAHGRRAGATRVVDAADQAALAGLGGRFDAVVEATNAPEGAAAALRLPRRGGGAILLGIGGAGRPTIDPDTITLNQLRVQGVFGASRAAWRWVVELYAGGLLDPLPLVTHRFALEQAPSALEALAAPDGDAVKVLVRPS